MQTAKEIRESFKEFFRQKGHHVVPSAPMVIKDDPTLMFTNAGMNQFKDIILGNRPAEFKRVCDSQKCLRVSGKHNDLEEAAVTAMAEAAGGRKIADEIAEHEWEERCYEFRARKVGVGEIPAEVIVPTVNWGEFTDDCYNGFKEMKMEAGGVIGVLVDRSTALFMPYYFKDDELLTGMLSFGFNFYLGDVAARYGGRSTGFGVFFAWAMDVIHNHETAAMTREIKTVLDPNDVVNPGHVTCGMTRFGVDMNKSLMSMGSALMQIMKKLFPADKTFEKNLARFRYDELEHIKTLDRGHKLGDGTQ